MHPFIRVLFLSAVAAPLAAYAFDHADAGKSRLTPKEIEAAFGRLSKLSLPMPFSEAWTAIGLPTEQKLEPLIFGSGSIGVYRWRLSESLADGSYYTFSAIYARATDENRQPMLLKAFFAIEHDEEDRPALVLTDHGFAFSELLKSKEKKEPNQSLEPTTLLGTSAAEQPLVPSRVVAHL